MPVTVASRRKDAVEDVTAHGMDVEQNVEAAARDIAMYVLARMRMCKRQNAARLEALKAAIKEGD